MPNCSTGANDNKRAVQAHCTAYRRTNAEVAVGVDLDGDEIG
jgi:hypothetical protein